MESEKTWRIGKNESETYRLQNEKKQDGTNRNRLHYKITVKNEKKSEKDIGK